MRKWHSASGELVRNLAEAADAGSLWVDASSEGGLDERAIRRNLPHALAVLYHLRDAGADVVLLRSERPGEKIAFAFRDAFCDTLEIVWEGAAIYDHRGWHGLPDEWVASADTGGPGQRAAGATPRLWHLSPAEVVALGIWEVLLAVVALLTAAPLLELLGSTASVQVVPIVIVSLLVGWLSGSRLLCLLRTRVLCWARRAIVGDLYRRLEALEAAQTDAADWVKTLD